MRESSPGHVATGREARKANEIIDIVREKWQEMWKKPAVAKEAREI